MGSRLLKNRYGAEIFVFHGVFQKNDLAINSRFVSELYFKGFLEAIQPFNLLSLEDFYSGNFEEDKFNLALTFDDGYLNNFEYAVPLLEQYEIPATFFITPIRPIQPFLWPDFVDLATRISLRDEVVFKDEIFTRRSGGEFWCKNGTLKAICKQSSFKEISMLQESFQSEKDAILSQENGDYWKLMDGHQIKYLADHRLFTVGAHGLTHASLTNTSVTEAKREISESKQRLEHICEMEIDAFAFPFGDYNENLIEHCVSVGLRKILLVDVDQNQANLGYTTRGRFVSNPHISVSEQIACLLKGSYY